jgi:hypothetical protein
LSNVELVNEALRGAKTDKHVGTDLDIWEAIGLLGGWYALRGLAASVGLGGFIVAILVGIGVDFGASTSAVAGFLLGLAGGGLFGVVAGFVIGTVRAATCHTKGDYDMLMQLIIPLGVSLRSIYWTQMYTTMSYTIFWRVTQRVGRPLTFTAAPGAGDHVLHATVAYQACRRDACSPPSTLRLKLPVKEAPLTDRELPPRTQKPEAGGPPAAR